MPRRISCLITSTGETRSESASCLTLNVAGISTTLPVAGALPDCPEGFTVFPGLTNSFLLEQRLPFFHYCISIFSLQTDVKGLFQFTTFYPHFPTSPQTTKIRAATGFLSGQVYIQ